MIGNFKSIIGTSLHMGAIYNCSKRIFTVVVEWFDSLLTQGDLITIEFTNSILQCPTVPSFLTA